LVAFVGSPVESDSGQDRRTLFALYILKILEEESCEEKVASRMIEFLLLEVACFSPKTLRRF